MSALTMRPPRGRRRVAVALLLGAAAAGCNALLDNRAARVREDEPAPVVPARGGADASPEAHPAPAPRSAGPEAGLSDPGAVDATVADGEVEGGEGGAVPADPLPRCKPAVDAGAGLCDPELLVGPSTDLNGLYSAAVVDRWLYVTNFCTPAGGLLRVPLEGGAFESLYSDVGTPLGNCLSPMVLQGNVLVAANYHRRYVGVFPLPSGPLKAPLGELTGTPVDVAADDEAVFVAEAGIRRIERATGASAILVNEGAKSLFATDTHLYWSSADGAIKRARKDGNGIEVVARKGTPQAVHVSGDRVYWGDRVEAKVYTMIVGADPSTLVEITQGAAVTLPGKIVSDETHVYWVGGAGDNPAGVYRARKDGTGLVTLVAGLRFASTIALGPDHVYFTTGVAQAGAVYRIPK